MKWLVCLFAGLYITMAQAQEKGSPANMSDHSRNADSNIPTITAPETNEATQTMQGTEHDAMPGMSESSSTMDHEIQSDTPAPQERDMNMQGNAVPVDVRDPHAYSSGYTLGSGKYALSESRQLHLVDEHNFGALVVDRLEYGEGKTITYDTQAWFGRTYDRLVLKAEGDIISGDLEEARTELLWGHAIATFWDTQLGVRYDNGTGSDQSWLAFGIQGLAPYWFDVNATTYVSDSGKTAISLKAEYELLLTQKLILQPGVEVNLYSKRDEVREIGSGLSEIQAGLRLRYEFTRQIAPYIGIEWAGKFGETADYARIANNSTRETRWVSGVRFWF